MSGKKQKTARGASSVEYALLITGIAAVLVLAVFGLGDVTGGMFSHTCDELDAAAAASASC